MAKLKPAAPEPLKRPRDPRPVAVNPRLGAQTRKVLRQHYRAKHGVK